MRSRVNEVMPAKVRRSLTKLGADIATARKKHRLKVTMMVERAGISKQTYQRVERGDPTVSIAAYAMCLFVLGLGTEIGNLADAREDDVGLLLEAERLPTRVRDRTDKDPSL